ncbi:hypothetical protein ACWDUL_20875 [Nocardia niigatensis]
MIASHPTRDVSVASLVFLLITQAGAIQILVCAHQTHAALLWSVLMGGQAIALLLSPITARELVLSLASAAAAIAGAVFASPKLLGALLLTATAAGLAGLTVGHDAGAPIPPLHAQPCVMFCHSDDAPPAPSAVHGRVSAHSVTLDDPRM